MCFKEKGMQMMSVAFNGLLKKLPTDAHQSSLQYVHPVFLEESNLSSILKIKSLDKVFLKI